MIRVGIVDDHAIVRDGLRRLLASQDDVTVVGEAASGDEAVDLLDAAAIDVLLLDIAMPGRSFLDVIEFARQRETPTRVIVLSGYSEIEYAERAFRAGATGYVSKERSPAELLEAVAQVHGGQRYVTESLAQLWAAMLAGEVERPPHQKLSQREYQVLVMLGAGRSVRKIGEDLALSPKTVGTYRERVLEKLGLETTADLIRYAVKQGLVN